MKVLDKQQLWTPGTRHRDLALMDVSVDDHFIIIIPVRLNGKYLKCLSEFFELPSVTNGVG
jgi:hypothetical protein